MKKVVKVKVTLPNGSVQVFEIVPPGGNLPYSPPHADGRIYPLGSSFYWSIPQWEIAVEKMLAAGATIEEVE